MEKIEVNPNNPSKKEISAIVRILNEGSVVIYPTDTIYGYGCLATDGRAIRKIRRLKNMDGKKPLLILVGSLAMAKRYCRVNRRQESYLKKIWPGPVTAILASRGNLPRSLTGGSHGAGLGVRLPDSGFLIRIIKGIGVPLVSTSANISGEKPIIRADSYRPSDGDNPDALIDGGVLKGKASRVADIRDIDNVIILRR